MALAPPDSSALHDIALQAQTAVQKLAKGLAEAGANPAAVHTLTEIADTLHQVIGVLAQGAGAQGQEGSPAEEQGESPQQEQAEQAAPPPGATPPPHAAQAAHPATLGAASQALHQAMIASAQQRQAQPQ